MSTEFRLKTGLADMLKGGAIMDVTNADQARIAEDAGAVSVMALERVPADIRRDGGVARMSSPEKIREIIETVSIPVMAKVRIGHFVEAQILQEMGVDFVDESEVLTPADEENHIDKHSFEVPFVCGCRQPRRGAPPDRRRGGADSHQGRSGLRQHRGGRAAPAPDQEPTPPPHDPYRRRTDVRRQGTPRPLRVGANGGARRTPPVPNFAAGGVATPADAALCMQLGAESVFVGSGIFKSTDPEVRAKAIVKAVTHYRDPATLVEVSMGLGEPMRGLDIATMPEEELLQTRGN